MSPVAAICTALLGLLLFGQGLVISAVRFRSGSLAYHSTDPNTFLCRLVRAHGNTAEYVPFLALLFLYFGLHSPSQLQAWLMVGATVSRFLVVLGLLAWPSMAKPNPARFVGSIGTYVFGLTLCFEVLRGA